MGGGPFSRQKGFFGTDGNCGGFMAMLSKGDYEHYQNVEPFFRNAHEARLEQQRKAQADEARVCKKPATPAPASPPKAK